MKIPHRIVLSILTSILLLPFRLPAAEPILHDGDLVGIAGDSITGQLIYSVYIEQYLMMCQPAPNLEAMYFGLSAERAPGFSGRLEVELLPYKPEIVTTCYGMNDGEYKSSTPGTIEAFRAGTLDFVRKLKTAGTRTILLGSPGAVDPNANGRFPADYNSVLGELGDVAREIAKSEGLVFVDVHTPMMEATAKAQAKYGKTYLFAQDGIHPSPNGHIIMAYAFLKAMGVDGNIGTLTVDYAKKTATGTPGQEIKGYQNGVLSVESTRYPFCFTSDKLGEGSLAMTEFFPFNEELNRYRLVVKNAPARSRVTWGAKSKDFTAAQLGTGINLAAEFPENPFVEPFAAATKAMQAQQMADGNDIKFVGQALYTLQRSLPEGGAHYNELRELLFAKAAKLRKASREAIKPVGHQVKIEAVP